MDYALRARGWLDEYCGKPGSRCYIAEAKEEAVGLALLIVANTKEAEVRIALHPERTGQGLGRRIMLAIMETGFSELGLDVIHLVVRKNNFPAMKLYNNIGFTSRGECTLIIRGQPIEFIEMNMQKEAFRNLMGKEGQ